VANNPVTHVDPTGKFGDKNHNFEAAAYENSELGKARAAADGKAISTGVTSPDGSVTTSTPVSSAGVVTITNGPPPPRTPTEEPPAHPSLDAMPLPSANHRKPPAQANTDPSRRDYVSISFGLYVGLGTSRSLTMDKYGNVYWGGGNGSGFGGKGFSVTSGTVLNGPTDEQSLKNTISGESSSWQVNVGVAVGVTTSSNGVKAIEYGGGPGLGASGNRSNHTAFLGNPFKWFYGHD
jgi:hypothetical protein